MTSSGLAERAGLEKSATSKAIMGLPRKGLISRLSRPGDRRFAQIERTSAGRVLHARILPLVQEINRQMMASLSEVEITQRNDFLDRLQEQTNRMVSSAGTLPSADRRRGGSRQHQA